MHVSVVVHVVCYQSVTCCHGSFLLLASHIPVVLLTNHIPVVMAMLVLLTNHIPVVMAMCPVPHILLLTTLDSH